MDDFSEGSAHRAAHLGAGPANQAVPILCGEHVPEALRSVRIRALADHQNAALLPEIGVLWVSFAFSGTLGLNRMFAAEKENSCLQGLLMVSVDRGIIYLGKLIAACVFMLLTEAVIFVFSLIFFNLTVWREIPYVVLVCLVGTLGFTAVGALLSAIAANTKMREVLLPLILFPVVLPILVNAVEATAIILNTVDYRQLKLPLTIMTVFTIVFATLAYLLFEYVLED